MRLVGLFSRRRGRVGINIGLSVAATSLVISAVTSTGIPVTHVAANDGGIWVTNNAQATYARFNYPIGQLDTSFGPPGAFQNSYNLDILQQGTTVIAIDRNKGDLYAVNPTSGTVNSTGVALPGGAAARVSLGGQVAAVLDPLNGEIWASNVATSTGASLSSLGTSGRPLLRLKGAKALVVGLDGTVYVASNHELATLPYSANGIGRPIFTSFSVESSLTSAISLTAVGDTPVLYDPSRVQLILPLAGKSVIIPDTSSTMRVSLQQAGPRSSSVEIATSSALYAVPLIGGPPQLLAKGGSGNVIPAAPVFVGDCVNSAWGGGTGIYARVCSGSPSFRSLVPGALLSDPVFRVNNGNVLLNDLTDGAAWNVANKPTLVLNSADYQRLASAGQQNASRSLAAQQVLAQSQKPKAVDVNTQARVGRTSVLHILDGDTNPTGGPLSIASVFPAQGVGYQVQISPDTQTVAVTLDSGVSAPIHFQYTIINAQGASSSANVTVSPTAAETPPVLRSGFTPTTRSIASSATASYQVLGNWRDKENDPLALVSAQASLGTVTWTGDGLISYSAPSLLSDTPVTVSYSVTDGIDQSQGTLQLLVMARGDTKQVAPVAQPDVASVVVGQSVTIKPLLNDIPGADPLHPNATLVLAGPVASVTGLVVSTDIAQGQIQLLASQPGVYSLNYQDSFGSAPLSSTQILVIAKAAANIPASPITLPSAVLLHGQLPSIVDVLANDYDPAGGLLTIVGASAPPGISVSVVKGQWLRVVSTSGQFSGWQVLNYSVTNGLTSPVSGEVLVSWAPPPPPSPPVALPMTAVVRAGDEVDVPVLDNVTDPTGGAVALVPGSASVLPNGSGNASIDGGILRFAAPPAKSIQTPQQVVVSYGVEDQSGEQTTGYVTITINPLDPATDAAPLPREVDVRVTAGGTVTIPIPTTGVDPNGDSVSVSGVVVPPELGRILSVSATSITYQAYPRSAGTDNFSYQVEDPYGLSGVATIRVAVVPPSLVAPPVATPLFVTGAPGEKFVVNVLASDIIAPGDSTTLESLAKTNAHLPGGYALNGSDSISVTAPTGSQPVTINYGITDGSAPPSIATLTVRSQKGFVVPPVAVDDFASQPSKGHSYVIVNALSNDYDPAGTPSDLRLVKVFSGDATIVGQRIKIPILASPRVVVYEIKNPFGATAIGVVHVPALLGTATLSLKVKPIQVPRGGTVSVNINHYITDSKGPVKLVSNAGVFASPAAGLSWHPVSYSALALTDVGGYDGPGAVTVQVTQASTASSTQARISEISIPVQVGPPNPVLQCPSAPLTLVQGGAPLSIVLSSECQIWSPTETSASSYSFGATWSSHPQAVQLALGNSNSTLVLSAGSSASPGTTGTIKVTIPGTTASSVMTVQVESAPLPTMASINIPSAKTGVTQSIDVSQYVTSPLSSPQLAIVGIHEVSGGSATATFSGTTLQITPQPGASGVDTFAVSVTDLVAQKSTRTATGIISMQVLDAPGSPGALQGVVGNQQVALSWAAAPANGAPVDYYEVSLNGGTPIQVNATSYLWTGLVNGTSYTFSVRAHNGVGPSTSEVTASFMPQSVPGSPGSITATSGDGSVALSWGTANPNGQPVTYEVSVSPAPSSGQASTQVSGTSYSWSGLNNNVGPYTFTVTPINPLGPGPSVVSGPVYTYGIPTAPTAPTAVGSISPDQSSTTITVAWPGTSLCDDARTCATYTVLEYKNGSLIQTLAPSSPVCASGSGFCISVGPLANDGSMYNFALEQSNAEGKTSSPSALSSPSVTAVGIPSQITDLSVKPGNQALTATFTLPAAHGATLSSVNYTLTNSSGGSNVSGSWSNPGTPGQSVSETIGNLVNGDNYAVTVDACNEAGECSTSSNTASTVPYGQPYPPVVTASPSGDSIAYTWSGGGNNGQAVNHYVVCVDGVCPWATTSTPSKKTASYSCNTTHTIYAYVIDAVGQQSANSATVTASTAACVPPNAPSVSATNGNSGSITFSWSGGGGGSFPIQYYNVCINGSCSQYSPSGPFSVTNAYSCGTNNVTLAVNVVDTSGVSSATNSTTGSTAACPPPSPIFTIAWSTNYPTWTSWTWSNFPPGYTSFICDENGAEQGSYSYSFATSGSIDNGATCYDGYSGQKVYVIANGPNLPSIDSNTITVP